MLAADSAARDSRAGPGSPVTGVVFLAGFVGIASGSRPGVNLAFVAAVLLVWAWLTALDACTSTALRNRSEQGARMRYLVLLKASQPATPTARPS